MQKKKKSIGNILVLYNNTIFHSDFDYSGDKISLANSFSLRLCKIYNKLQCEPAH